MNFNKKWQNLCDIKGRWKGVKRKREREREREREGGGGGGLLERVLEWKVYSNFSAIVSPYYIQCT